MASPADLQKLIENMKRANGLVDRAASDAVKHASTMDSFEKRLNLNDENMGKIAEYEKLMAQMDMGSNGGPALDATFPSTGANKPDAAPAGLISSSTKGVGRFDQ